jgi:two-component system cell cycle response regulator
MNIPNWAQFDPGQAKILVVDDTPANLTLLVQMLSGHGYKVRVAPTGKLALASAQSNPPDLILLDVNMPDMNGYAVCHQLKASDRTRDIPIIFISALDSVFNKVTAFTSGGIDYITKPFELVEVLARIQNQLRLRHFQLQLQTQNNQLQLLLTTTQAIAEATDVHTALEVALRKICQTIDLAFGEVWIQDADTYSLQCHVCYHTFSLIEQHQNISLGLASPEFIYQILQSRQSIWTNDLRKESHYITNVNLIEKFGLKASFGIPIQSDDQILAALVFFCKNQVTIDLQSLNLVNAVATQLGTLIQRKKAEAALRQANQALERLANLDGLTQVANRRRFDEYLMQEWSRSLRYQTPLSLILFDVDYFKAYNDCYGHLRGDECLQQIVQAASQEIKRPTDLLARYGGEEFAVVLPNTTLDGAIIVAQAIQLAVQRLAVPHTQSQIGQIVTISLGVASLSSSTQSTDDLIISADQALYEAKSQGRDRIAVKGALAK